MKNVPYLWFCNVVRLLEKRPYAVFNVLLFSLFVGAFRLFAEWALGGFYPKQMLVSLLTVSGFYWLSFFVIAAVLRGVVDQPWRVSINVILVGIFLGVFPPIVDAVAGGTGFNYTFMWDLWNDWRWGIYNPEKNIPLGEAAVLWAVILLTGLYVHLKSTSLRKTGAGLVLGYAAVMVIAGVPATLSESIRDTVGWPLDHRAVLQVLMQYALALVVYLYLQRGFTAAVMRHGLAGVPYLLLCFWGSAFVGPLSSTTFLYAGAWSVFLLTAFSMSPRSNADLEDRRFFTVTMLFVLTTLAAANSTTVMPLSFAALAILAKPRLPRWTVAGALAASAFLLGVVAAVEHSAYEAPRWWISFVPRPLHAEALRALDDVTLLAVPAVFTAAALLVAFRGKFGRA